MSNVSAKKVFIQIESATEQQEHLKNQRNALKVLQQGVAIDKENLAGRPQIDKLSRLKAATDVTLASTEYAKRKKVETRSSDTQTSPSKQEITAEDLTGDTKPSELYWEKLAEKRRSALEETLVENQRLHERIEGLEDELNTSKQMLAEARNLVDVLTEMLNENEAAQELKDVESSEAVANADDDKEGDDEGDGDEEKGDNDEECDNDEEGDNDDDANNEQPAV